jgi:hypothetical protein
MTGDRHTDQYIVLNLMCFLNHEHGLLARERTIQDVIDDLEGRTDDEEDDEEEWNPEAEAEGDEYDPDRDLETYESDDVDHIDERTGEKVMARYQR